MDKQKMKENHEKIRNITNDVYNNFYRSAKNLNGSEDDWDTIITSMSKELEEKYKGDRFCKELLLVFENELERNWIKEKELDNKETKQFYEKKQLSR